MSKDWFRPKYVVFDFIFWMMAYVLNHNERFVIDSNDPIWNHYQSFKWWLLPYAVAGTFALDLGPMQIAPNHGKDLHNRRVAIVFLEVRVIS